MILVADGESGPWFDTHHGHGVQLSQRRHSLQQKHNKPTTFYGLNCTGKEVWCDGLEVLQDQHTKGVPKDLLGFLVVALGSEGHEIRGISLIHTCSECL